MSKAYLGLGSNVGDKKANLEKAIQLLEDNKSVIVIKKSSYYETEPVGYKEQDWFLNMVVEIETSFEPEDLLEYCQWIEKELKRKRIVRWGPRTIDVDILVYEDYESNDEMLTIPHPRICERAFVMIPLHEIAPALKIKGKSIEELLKNFKGEEIKKI